MRPRSVQIVEYTDPGCSWAWGSEPKLRLLRWRYGERIDWRRVLGGLVGDMDAYTDGPFDPERAAAWFGDYWKNVLATTGMPYPVRLRWMYRSTEPACLAVKAAEPQGEAVAQRVLRRLREATFVHGEPPDTLERILAELRAVPGFDERAFERAFDADEAKAAFRRDWEETREPNEAAMNVPDDYEGAGRAKHTEGHWRYAFPTLIVRGPSGERTLTGWRPYEAYEQALEAVAPGVTADPRPDPDPARAFLELPSMTSRELEVLCGPGAEPPPTTVAFDWGDGVLWRTPEEAAARGSS